MSILSQEAGEQGEHTLKRSLGALNLITLGIGAVIGAGIFVLTGTGCGAARGAGGGAELCAGRNYLRVCGALLCGVRFDDSHCGVGIHIWLCDAGRTGGVDHRLGSGAGVRFWRGDGGLGMVGVLQQPAAQWRIYIPPQTYGDPGTDAGVLHQNQWMPVHALPLELRARVCSTQPGSVNLMAILVIGDYDDAGDWHQGVGQFQLGDCDRQADDRGNVSRAWADISCFVIPSLRGQLASFYSAFGRAWAILAGVGLR